MASILPVKLFWILRVPIFFLCFFSLTANAQVASGIVYDDLNRNGSPDAGEPGIANVCISNGSEVVVTNKNGMYRMPVSPNSVIFVIKPSGYALPVDQRFVATSHYLYYPQGSQKLAYPGVSATGSLPSQINFGLFRVQEKETFNAVFFGDTQPYSLNDIDYLGRDILPELLQKPDFEFVSVLGDVVGDNLNLYPSITAVLAQLKKPVYYVQGNHDENYDVTSDLLAAETFRKTFGPLNYAFNIARVHFVVLDNIVYSGDTATKAYEEGFSEEAIRFLKNDLMMVDPENLVVLMMHAPFVNEYRHKPILNLDKVLKILEPFPHTFSISGHNHTLSQQLIGKEEGWLKPEPHHHFNTGTVCGDWWRGSFDETGLPETTMRDGSPNGYALVHFTGSSYSVDYKVARRPDSYTMNIFSPRVIDSAVSTTSWKHKEVFVNFFMGSPKDKLRCRIDGGSWFDLQYTVEPDPVYANLRNAWDKTDLKLFGRKPSRPEPCLHLWKAVFPTEPGKGSHTLEVEATDFRGRKFTAYQLLQVF